MLRTSIGGGEPKEWDACTAIIEESLAVLKLGSQLVYRSSLPQESETLEVEPDKEEEFTAHKGTDGGECTWGNGFTEEGRRGNSEISSFPW